MTKPAIDPAARIVIALLLICAVLAVMVLLQGVGMCMVRG